MPMQPPHPGDPAADAAPVRDPRTRLLRWATAAALLGALIVYNSLHPGSSNSAIGAPAPVASGEMTMPPAARAAAAARAQAGLELPRSLPTRLTIPAIGVNAPFAPLSLAANKQLQPPPENNANLVGYYAAGPMPGQRGNAIVAGHVDTKTGPAVFLMLGLLKPGSTANIKRADGVTATFKVDSVETFSKNKFPNQRVYGKTPDAELRIITCGGSFDHAKQDYKDNVVVFAHLESSKRG